MALEEDAKRGGIAVADALHELAIRIGDQLHGKPLVRVPSGWLKPLRYQP